MKNAALIAEFPDDRYPCVYAHVNNAGNRSKSIWVVGVNRVREPKCEYSFAVSDVCSVDDDDGWVRAVSLNTAVMLMGLFKSGGPRAVESWVRDGNHEEL